jgi:hypothetical protein
MDPLSAGMFASIGSAFKFADVAVRIAEVGSENAVFVRTIYVVRSDLEEVERLLSLEPVRKKLAATPGKHRIDQVRHESSMGVQRPREACEP